MTDTDDLRPTAPWSFWTSMPGVLTGIAAVITAVATVYGLNQILPLGSRSDQPDATTQASSTGPMGPAGPTGPAGPSGPSGRDAPGLTRTMISKYDWPLLAPGKEEYVNTTCPTGTMAVGGGFYVFDPGMFVFRNSMVEDPADPNYLRDWVVGVRNTSGGDQHLYTYVVCLGGLTEVSP